MKIIRRSFGERFALLELDNGDYYHLDLDSKYIPSVGDELVFDEFSFAADDLGRSVYCILHHDTPEMYYLKTDAHTLKEL